MFLRFFRSTGAQMIVAIPFIGIMLWIGPLLNASHVQFLFDEHPMPLYKFVTDIVSYNSVLGTLITLALVIVQGFLLVRLNTRFIFINNRSYLPALFFVLLSATIPDFQRLNPVIFSGFFLLLALEKIFESFNAGKVAYEYFLASILISTGALFYPFLLVFLMVLWISLGIIRPFNWREWVYTILGFFVPHLFIFGYYYLVHNEPLRLFNDYKEVFLATFTFPEYNVFIISFVIYLGIIVVLASYFMITTISSKKILPRKGFIIFLWLFLISAVVFLLTPQVSVEMLFIAAIPLSYVIAHYFALMKSVFWGNIFITLMIVFLAVIQIFG